MLQTHVMRRTSSIVVVALICAVLLTGCLRAEIGVEVGDDGSGRVRIEIYVPTVELRRQGISEAMLEQVTRGLGEAAGGTGADVDVSKVATADEQGISISFPFDDVSQVQAAMTGRDPSMPMVRMFETLDVHKGPDGGWVFRGTVAPQGVDDTFAQLGRMLAESTGTAHGLAVDPTDVSVAVSMTLPGEIATTNATDVDGGRARWVIKGDGAVVDLSMRNSPSPFDPVTLAVVVGVGVVVIGLIVVVIGLLVVVLVRRRRRRRQITPTPVGDWGPPPGVPGADSRWQSPPGFTPGWGPPTGAVPGPLPPPPGQTPHVPPAGSVPLGGVDGGGHVDGGEPA